MVPPSRYRRTQAAGELLGCSGRRSGAAPGLGSENAAHRIAVEWEDASGVTRVGVYIPNRRTSSQATVLLGGRVFPGVHRRSQFTVTETPDDVFAEGGAGYSATYDPHRLDGIELRTNAWSLQAAVVHRLRSSFFDDPRRFPTGTLQLDTALLMRQLPVTGHGLASLWIEPRKQSAAGPRL